MIIWSWNWYNLVFDFFLFFVKNCQNYLSNGIKVKIVINTNEQIFYLKFGRLFLCQYKLSQYKSEC